MPWYGHFMLLLRGAHCPLANTHIAMVPTMIVFTGVGEEKKVREVSCWVMQYMDLVWIWALNLWSGNTTPEILCRYVPDYNRECIDNWVNWSHYILAENVLIFYSWWCAKPFGRQVCGQYVIVWWCGIRVDFPFMVVNLLISECFDSFWTNEIGGLLMSQYDPFIDRYIIWSFELLDRISPIY